MQAALQGVLDAVLRARRGPWLHPESSPAWGTDAGQPGEPRTREARGLAGQLAETAGTHSRCNQPAASRAGPAPGLLAVPLRTAGPTAQATRSEGWRGEWRGAALPPPPQGRGERLQQPRECPRRDQTPVLGRRTSKEKSGSRGGGDFL